MESNITEQRYFNDELQLSEPHFDEEATLLSARPVVPLQEIKAAAPNGRRLVFGLSILVSLIVGALGATLIYKQRGQKSATAIVETAVAGSGARAQDSAVTEASIGEAGKEVAPAEMQNAGSAADDKKLESQTIRTERSQPQTNRVETAKLKREQRTISRVDERDSRYDEKEMRRADQAEARRLRRRAERESQSEARRHKAKSSDDLLRIREIFEGSPRP
jgi:flagellar biosynthesis GTPase FlhF